jgi:hypothetical protein
MPGVLGSDVHLASRGLRNTTRVGSGSKRVTNCRRCRPHLAYGSRRTVVERRRGSNSDLVLAPNLNFEGEADLELAIEVEKRLHRLASRLRRQKEPEESRHRACVLPSVRVNRRHHDDVAFASARTRAILVPLVHPGDLGRRRALQSRSRLPAGGFRVSTLMSVECRRR